MDRIDVRLRHGPQDGSKVRVDFDPVPEMVWVGPKWLGDGYSAYTRFGPSKRFPALYRYQSEKGFYQFDPGN